MRQALPAASKATGFGKRKEKKSTMGKEIFELIAPCHFGMEAVLKREINDLGYEISKVENGKVTFWQTPKESAVEIFSFARRSVFYSKWQNLRRRHLTNYLKPVRRFHGSATFLKMENSGWRKQPPSIVNCSVHRTYSALLKKQWWKASSGHTGSAGLPKTGPLIHSALIL